jgi:hypothetical protein
VKEKQVKEKRIPRKDGDPHENRTALYDVERQGKELTWQERQALRQRESTVVLDALWRWLDTAPLREVLPKSDFAEALRYIRNQWKEINCVDGVLGTPSPSSD